MNISAFVHAIFRDLGAGCIEVRLIEDRKGGAVVERCWYATPAELLADLDRLNALAGSRNAAVFYGVLPRKMRGTGKAEDTLPSRVIWADVDFKDFEGGEAEARALLQQFPVPPNIIVRSAHGLHLYWLLTTEQSPEELSRTAKGIATVLRADSCHNRDRLLRLPGTFNRKNPESPIEVTVEKLDAEHRVTIEQIDEALGEYAPEGPANDIAMANFEVLDAPPHTPPSGLSARIQQLLASDRKLNKLFHGKGKEPIDKKGNPQDCSSSGYDMSFVCMLVKLGVVEATELATALKWRPDGHAHGKGTRYVQLTVAKALAHINESKKSAKSPEKQDGDFTIEQIVIYNQHPTRYEVTVEGQTFLATTSEIIAPRKFRLKLADVLRRAPRMPEPWSDFINAHLAAAERIPMPLEASFDPALGEAIEEAIAGLQEGEDQDSLRDSKAWIVTAGKLAGRRVFTIKSLLKPLQEEYADLDRGALCMHLRRMGYEDDQLTEGTRPRVWSKCPNNAREENHGDAR